MKTRPLITILTLVAIATLTACAPVGVSEPKEGTTTSAQTIELASPTLKSAGCATPYTVMTTANVSGQNGQGNITGTTAQDLISFANQYNKIRSDNCLPTFPISAFRYDPCMETRLIWMAEDPSLDPMSAWGHIGSVRSDGVPSVGCDGNLAGGSGSTGASVAQKWWNSASHKASLYRPGTAVTGNCILFSMEHGGVPNEPTSFVRAAARWTTTCPAPILIHMPLPVPVIP